MKKFFTLLSLLVVMGMSANVMAQSTGETPAPGATHSYSVTGNTGSTYTWSVTAGDLTTSAGDDAVLSATDGVSINITWASDVTVGDWYYVHVVEADGSCTNEKVMPVQISESDFYLTITAALDADCYDGDVSISLATNEPQYDHGNATIVYTVTPEGLSTSYTGYSFDLSLAVPSGYTNTVEFSANASISGSTVTVTDNADVTITYTVDNTNVYTNDNDADGSAADFIATATISSGVTSNGVSDNGNDGTYSDATAVSRPHTTKITTD